MAPDTVCQNLQATNALLARVACQLEQQTAELQDIRRATTSCEQHLSIVKRAVQQLVTLATITAEACCTIALAAAEFLNTAATAQSVRRLQLAISSGRLVMLALLLPLCIVTSSRTVHKLCAIQHLHSNNLPLSWLPVPAAAKQLLQQYVPQRKQMHTGLLGLIRGSYRWCLMSTAGCYAAGLVILITWAWHSWRSRAPSQHTALAAANTPADPLLAVLLAALPVNNNDSQLLAVALPAAVYQGALGGIAVAAVSGRWFSWLILWEAWLACCCYSCRRLQHVRARASNRVIIEHQHHHQMQHGLQIQQKPVYPVIYESMLEGPPVHQHQQQGLFQRSSRQVQLLNHCSAGQQSGTDQSAVRSSNANAAGIGSSELRLQLALAAVQLILPAVMAVIAVCR